MFEHSLSYSQVVPVPFDALHANPNSILACLPRVAEHYDAGDGSHRIIMQPIKATPLIRVQACGWVVIEVEDDCLRWTPKTCSASNGCLSGTACRAPNGQTRIEATVDIHHPDLPALPLFSRVMVEQYLRGWARRFMDEFAKNWHSQFGDS